MLKNKCFKSENQLIIKIVLWVDLMKLYERFEGEPGQNSVYFKLSLKINWHTILQLSFHECFPDIHVYC